MVYCLNGKHKNDFDIAWHIQRGPVHKCTLQYVILCAGNKDVHSK